MTVMMGSPSPGRYDRFFSPAELAELRAIPWNDLTPEMEILRDAVARFAESLRRLSPNGEPELTTADLRALGTAFGVLADLAALQLSSHAPLDEFQAEVEQAFHLTRIKLGLLPPDDPPPPASHDGPDQPLSPDDTPPPACPPPLLLVPPAVAPRHPPPSGSPGTISPIRPP